MSRGQGPDDRGHAAIRDALRVVGPLCIVVGVGLIAVAMLSFFSSMGTFEPPRYFWCAFLGMPILFVGVVLTNAGFMGAMIRYQANEAAPVLKDTANYLGEGVRPGVTSVAEALATGLAKGLDPGEPGANADGARCVACGTPNDGDARFCSQCGGPLGKKPCGQCGELAESDAVFCDQCGTRFG